MIEIDKTTEKKAFAFKVFHDILDNEINEQKDEHIKKYLSNLKSSYPTPKEFIHKHFQKLAESYITDNSNFF